MPKSIKFVFISLQSKNCWSRNPFCGVGLLDVAFVAICDFPAVQILLLLHLKVYSFCWGGMFTCTVSGIFSWPKQLYSLVSNGEVVYVQTGSPLWFVLGENEEACKQQATAHWAQNNKPQELTVPRTRWMPLHAFCWPLNNSKAEVNVQ